MRKKQRGKKKKDNWNVCDVISKMLREKENY